MNLFQVFLIVMVFLFLVYVWRFQKAMYNRFVMLIIGVMGIIFIIFPDITSSIAARVGIGRGVDLLFYTWIIFCLFKFLGYESRINELQKSVTELTRHIAIQEAESGEPSPTAGKNPDAAD